MAKPRNISRMTGLTPIATESVDVAIIGAGISGISAAYHLSTNCPDRTFTMLEQRSNLGGTWDLFRYPGIRSDSDMHTLGFRFAPWIHEESIAEGSMILEYLNETVDRFDLRRHICFQQKVTAATWSSEERSWTLTILGADGVRILNCNVLFVCAGYYSYRAGHTPELPGMADFGGRIVHPQQWPDDLDVAGSTVVVIGSGATAVTIVPALASAGADVTMLQRSPTYMVSAPNTDAFATRLREVLPERVAYGVTRVRNIARDQMIYKVSRIAPSLLRNELLRRVREELGPELTTAHFTPDYEPWDQRLCLVPNGDFFDAIGSGEAAVVTADIESIDEGGVHLQNGDYLEADIIITATGLALTIAGDIGLSVDGKPIDFAETVTYRGIAYSGVPNLFTTFGYVNASWTLRADMVSRYVCRLLNEMADVGASMCVPELRPAERDAERRGWIDDFSAGYVTRMLPELPKQLDRDPWRNYQSFAADQKSLLYSPIADGVMQLR